MVHGGIEMERKKLLTRNSYISLLLAEQRLSPHPYRVIPGGLQGIGTGVNLLYNQKVHAEKLVYR